MNSYLLSISVIVFLTSIISLILPDGKMGKYVKSFFSILILLVIISPIFKFDEFDFDEAALDNLSVKRFDAPSEEWALFVMANRSKNNIHPTHSFDIVVGPVADDTIATLFRNFDDGIIDLPMLVNGLRYKKISSQYFFHSADAIKYLKKI